MSALPPPDANQENHTNWQSNQDIPLRTVEFRPGPAFAPHSTPVQPYGRSSQTSSHREPRSKPTRAYKKGFPSTASSRHDTPIDATSRASSATPHDGQKITILLGPSDDITSQRAFVPSGPQGSTQQVHQTSSIRPDEFRRLFGISEFQTRYAGARSYDYEEKYAPDNPGGETAPEARLWKVYLDEAEVYDQEIIKGHRDSLDSLLVFLRALGNATAISTVPSAGFGPDSPTHSSSDVWVNGLFFVSLALSLSTALLSVLAKQWLQAYDSSTSGSARQRALVRHLRFLGMTQWSLTEIIGLLPLVLHASLAVFLAGIIIFLRELYPTISWFVIAVTACAFFIYVGSIILPAIDIRCPYRIPVLYRPMKSVVMFVTFILNKVRWHDSNGADTGNKLGGTDRQPFSAMRNLAFAVVRPVCTIANKLWSRNISPPSLKQAELSEVQDFDASLPIVYSSIAWLHNMSSNRTVRRIAAHGLAGEHCNFTSRWASPAAQTLCDDSIMYTVTDALFDGSDVPAADSDGHIHPSVWVRALENLRESFNDLHISPAALKQKLSQDLYLAAATGRVAHIAYILNYGIDVNAPDPDGDTALQVASAAGHLSVVKSLLENGANIDMDGQHFGPALQAASRYGHLDVVSTLLEHGAHPNLKGGEYGSALQAAARHGCLGVVRLLLEKDADVNLESGPYGSAIQAASAVGHWDIVEVLVENGANVNLGGGVYGSALQAAAFRCKQGVVQLLLDKGASVNMGDGPYGSALQAAAARGAKDVVKVLLDNGADVNQQGGPYGSSLQAASARGDWDIVQMLSEKDADMNMEGGPYGSALQAAILFGRVEIQALLRGHGAVN